MKTYKDTDAYQFMTIAFNQLEGNERADMLAELYNKLTAEERAYFSKLTTPRMTIPTFKIGSVEDVRQFFRWLLENNMLTHPDDSFHYMIDNMEEDGEEPNITREQADYLDEVRERCIDLCDDLDADVYGICLDEIDIFNSLAL